MKTSADLSFDVILLAIERVTVPLPLAKAETLWAICKVNISQRLGGFLECQGPARRKGVAAGCGSRVFDKGQGAGFGGLPGVFRGKARSFGREGPDFYGGRRRTRYEGKDRGQRTAPGKPVARLKAETPRFAGSRKGELWPKV